MAQSTIDQFVLRMLQKLSQFLSPIALSEAVYKDSNWLGACTSFHVSPLEDQLLHNKFQAE